MDTKMNNNLLQKFDELFKDIDHLSIENLEGLVHESLKAFEFLKEKLDSPNEEERKEAMALAQQIQKKLEEQAEKAYAATGMNRGELDTFMTSSQNFTPEEWNSLGKAQTELSEYKSSLYRKEAPKVEEKSGEKAKKKRVPLTRIQG
jgi:hypothetical protein